MKLNWGFGILVSYLIFAGTMVLFAVKASQQSNDLVTDEYYEDAVNYQQKIDASKNALDGTSLIDVRFINESKTLELLANDSLNNYIGMIYFYKPDDSKKDFNLDFKINNGTQSLYSLNSIPSGIWKMNISWTIGQKKYYLEKRITVN